MAATIQGTTRYGSGTTWRTAVSEAIRAAMPVVWYVVCCLVAVSVPVLRRALELAAEARRAA